MSTGVAVKRAYKHVRHPVHPRRNWDGTYEPVVTHVRPGGLHRAETVIETEIPNSPVPPVVEIEHPGMPVEPEHRAADRVARARKNVTKRSRRGMRWIRPRVKRVVAVFRRKLRKTGRMLRRGFVWSANGLANVSMFAFKWVDWVMTPLMWTTTNAISLGIRSVARLSLAIKSDLRFPRKMIARFPYRTFPQVYADSIYEDRWLILLVSWLLQPVTGHDEHRARKDQLYMDVVSLDPKHYGAWKHFKDVHDREAELAYRAARRAEPKRRLPGYEHETYTATPENVAEQYEERGMFRAEPRTDDPMSTFEQRWSHTNATRAWRDAFDRWWVETPEGEELVYNDEPLAEHPPAQSEADLSSEAVVTEEVKAAAAEASTTPTEGETEGALLADALKTTEVETVVFDDEAARNWKRATNRDERSYLYGCNAAYEAYSEDSRFLEEDRLVSEIRTQVNNDTQSPRSGIKTELALKGYDDTVHMMRNHVGRQRG